MKVIAIPSKGEMIEDHFGQCENYTIVRINEQNEVSSKESFPTPQGCGCKSNLAEVLAEKGVRFLIAGNMGQGAKNVLRASGIKVMCGFSGSVDHAISLHLKEGFEGDETVCHHHGHECNH